jgi:hypothetical protein
LYLSGSALDLGVGKLGSFLSGSTFGFTPNTNAATLLGLPDQEATALGNMAQDSGGNDDVSRDAPPSPTATLTALAAAGRNPADITLPTAGTEAVDPPPGSHEVAATTPPGGWSNPDLEGEKAFWISLWRSTGGAVYSIFTGEAGTALGERAYNKSVQRGYNDPGVATVVGLVGEDLIGAQAVEGASGFNLETSQEIPGGIFDGGERSQRLANGAAAFFGTAAGIEAGVAQFTPLGPKMFPKAPAPKTPLQIQAEGYGAAAEAGPVPPAVGRTPLPVAVPETAAASAEQSALRILQEAEANAAPGAHFLSRHGAQTTLEQQFVRARTGVTPEGLAGNPVDSGRFLSHQAELAAYNRALELYKASPQSQIVFEMDSVIGEGFTKFGKALVRTTNVVARFDKSGRMITLYPSLSPLP